jgi:hypothetical protein
MKTRTRLIIGSLVLLIAALFLWSRGCGQPVTSLRVTGPLTTNDVAEITRVVLSGRAPLLPGHFASPKDRVALERRLRERAAADFRSIKSVDGQTATVDFGDRWDARIGYDYDLERTTNSWKVIGVGWRGPARR